MTEHSLYKLGFDESQIHFLRRTFGADVSVLSIEPVTPGGNSRVYRVGGPSGETLVKVYPRDETDPRNRLATEYGFCRFVWESGIRSVPRALNMDADANVGCYEYVRGRKLQAGDVRSAHVDQAIQFALQLQSIRRLPGADQLSAASEACFSLPQHLGCVDGRVRRLRELSVADDVDVIALRWLDEELEAAWRVIRERAVDWMRREDGGGLTILDPRERVLSPSDFGFHNALMDQCGRLRFIDFEYAGWDDPAKLICDFFCQPAVPAAEGMFGKFAEAICSCTPEPARHRERIRMLLPVFQIKWCCIMLNIFLPAGICRRQFVHGQHELRELKLSRLQAAKAMLAKAACMPVIC